MVLEESTSTSTPYCRKTLKYSAYHIIIGRWKIPTWVLLAACQNVSISCHFNNLLRMKHILRKDSQFCQLGKSFKHWCIQCIYFHSRQNPKNSKPLHIQRLFRSGKTEDVALVCNCNNHSQTDVHNIIKKNWVKYHENK